MEGINSMCETIASYNIYTCKGNLKIGKDSEKIYKNDSKYNKCVL